MSTVESARVVGVECSSPIASTSKSQRGAKAVAQTIVSKLLIQGLNAITGILTARMLMPAGRGQLAAIILWPIFLAGLTTLGVPSSLVYFLRQRSEEHGSLIATGVLITLLLGIVAGLVGVVWMPHWLHQYPLWAIRGAQWIMIITPLYSLSFAGRAILEANGDFSASNLSQVVNPLTVVFCLFGLLIAHRLTVMTAAVAYSVPLLPVIALLIYRVLPFVVRSARPSTKSCRLLLSYGLRSYGIDLLGTLALQVDQVLVISMLTPADMGSYVVMLSLSRMFNVFQNSVNTVLFPKAAGRSPEVVLQLTGRAARVSLTVTACATACIAVIGPWLLRVFYGKDYANAAGCLRILLVEVTLSGLVFVLAQAFMALGRPGTVTILQATGLSLSIPLMFILIPRWGIEGAAASLLLSTTARLIFITFAFRYFLKTRTPNLLPSVTDFQDLLQTFRSRRSVAV